MKVILLSKFQNKIPTAPELCSKYFIESLNKSDLNLLSIEYFSDGNTYSIWTKLFGRTQNNNFEQLGILSLFFRLISYKPDLIHILNFERVWLVAIFYKLFFRCKLVFTVHGCVLHEHLNFKSNVPYFLFLKDRICEYFYFKFSDKIVFVSKKLMIVSKNYYFFNERKAEVIPNGFQNIIIFENTNTNRSGIVFVGSSSRIEKGLSFFLSTLDKVNTPTKVFIVGENKNNISVKNKIIEIQTIPLMENNEFINFLKSKHIFISPSLSDTFGLIIQEALSLNLQVIASSNCGITEFYQNKNLHLIDYGDVLYFASVLDKLLKLQTVTNENNLFLNWDNISTKYLELYKNLK